MSEQRNVVIGFISLIVIVGLIFWASVSFSPTPGNALPENREESNTESMQPVIQSHRSYHIKSNIADIAFEPDQPASYEFAIVDERGDVTKDFAVVHEKIMHVIVVREDLQEFQHLHPTFHEETGVFSLQDLTFPSDGPYRIFADFTPMGTQLDAHGEPLGVTIFEDIDVGNAAQYVPQDPGATTTSAAVDGYTVSLVTEPATLEAEATNMLTFAVRQNDQPVTDLQPYLGAMGHAVILREGDLQFIHAHPIEERSSDGTTQFHVTFPEAGTYKVFLQFQHEDKVTTASFVVAVEAAQAGTGGSSHDMIMPDMDHSMHGM